MKTLVQLKQDAKSGRMSMEMTERYGAYGEQIPEKLRGIRRVVGANTVALHLQNNDGNISELQVKCASLVEYDADTLVVYEAGLRDLTDEERTILAEWKRIEDEHIKQNPFGDTYWKRKNYFATCTCPWLDGGDAVRGKRLEYVCETPKIRDNSIKGEAILKYRVYFNEEVEV